MAAMVPRLQAEEALRAVYVQRIAGAAAAVVAATSKKVAESALTDYKRLVTGLQAQALGTAGQEVDGSGRPILRTANAIRKWFFDEGGIRV